MVNFTIDSSYLFWAKDPIRAATDPVWIAPVPNVDGAGSICWGTTDSDSSSLSAKIDDLVNNFFTTTFNEDLGHRTPFGTSLTQWETNSVDPLAWREWVFWNSTSMEVSAIAARMGSAEPTNMAELDPSFLDLPILPPNFTVLRAREWFDGLSAGAQRRLLLATREAELPEEVPA